MALNENLPKATSPNSMTAPTRPSQEIERVDKLYDSILMKVTKMETSLKKSAEYMQQMGGGKDSNVNIGSNSNVFSKVNDVTNATMEQLNKIVPPGEGPSGWDRFKAGVSSTAYYAAAMMPNTLDAVTQRISTQGVASMIGRDPNALIRQSNQLLKGGMTGPYSAQTSTAILASQGIIPTMGSYGNIMNQVGGLSVLTGMSNEQTASGMGGINGMNFLRMGINARNANGSLRDPASLSSDLYKRMFGAKNITAEQAAQVFNRNSRSYQDIAMAAGGDENLMATLQNTIYYQARNGGKKLDLNAENVKNNILKLPKDDPMRAMYHYQGSEANKLEATGTGLVGGYSGALNSTATVNDQFAKLARILPALTTAFGNLKGFLDTLPTAGNTGAAMYGGISQVAQKFLDGKSAQFTSKALDKLFGTNTSGQGQPGVSNQLAITSGPGQLAITAGPHQAANTPMGAATNVANQLADKGLHAMWGKLTGKEGQSSLMQDIKKSGGMKAWGKNLFSAVKDATVGYAKGGVKGAVTAAAKDLAPKLGRAVMSAGDAAFGYGDQTQTGGWSNQTSMQPIAGVAGPYEPSGPSQGSAIQYPEDYPGAYRGDPNDPSKVTWVPGSVQDPVTGKFVSNMEARNAWLASQGQKQGGDSGGGSNTLLAPGSMKNLLTKGRSFMKSPMGKMAGRVALGAATVMATNWAVPKLRAWGAKHGIKDHSLKDNIGTTAAYMGGYAAAGAMVAGPAGAVVGALAGLARGLWYSTHKPEKEEKPKKVKHDRWGQIYDPVTGNALLPINQTTGQFDSDEFDRTGYGQANPDLKRWQQGGYPTPSTSWLNEGKGSSESSLTNIIKKAGFGPRATDIAYAVAMAESGGKATAHNTNKKTGDNSYGLFQINMIGDMGPNRRKQFHLKSNDELLDPLTNAKAAYAISNKGTNWSPWSTYKTGAYKKHLHKSGANDSTDLSKLKANQNNETKSDLPRNAREAAQWAIQQVKSGSSGWNNYCERFTETAWGKPGRYKSALAGWEAAKKEGRAYQGKTPPPGAMVYWGGGEYGHAAVSIGGGKIVSTDIKRKGKADIVTIDYLTKQWSKPYLGWADPDKGTKLNASASPIDPGSVNTDTSVISAQQHANNGDKPWWKDLANSVGNFFGSNTNNNNSASSSNSSSGNELATLLNVTGTGFSVNSASTSAMLGMGSSPSMSGSDGGITINMNVNIASASTGDAQRLARQVKDILQRELRTDSIRNY